MMIVVSLLAEKGRKAPPLSVPRACVRAVDHQSTQITALLITRNLNWSEMRARTRAILKVRSVLPA